ncbi:MAG: UDP-N-acetylmuramate--L-alanine ligase, partial [Oscillospiraceae bacterium]
DMTILAEIYAAREQNTIGISSRDMAKEIPNSLFFDNFDEIEKTLRWTAAPGDIILTVGAGDIYKVGERLVGKD